MSTSSKKKTDKKPSWSDIKKALAEYARAVTLVYMNIHKMKSDLDLLGSINLVENEIGRKKILASLNSRHFDRNLI